MHKIAYLVSVYPGVSHTFIFNEVQELRKIGCDIEVASINEPEHADHGDLPNVLAEEKNTFYVKRQGLLRISCTSLLTLFKYPLGFAKGLFYVGKYAKFDLKKIIWNFCYFIEACVIGSWMDKNQINHLHVHFANAAATVGMFVSIVFPKTYSMTVHGPDEFFAVGEGLLVEKIQHSKFIVCIGHFARSQLMMHSPYSKWKSFHICPLGVDVDIFTPKKMETIDRIELLCVGRLVPVKGQSILLEAVSELVKEGFYLRLRFIGDGPDRFALEKLSHDLQLTTNVEFLGALNHKQVLELLEETDLFILPTFSEGIPMVLMEAMAKEVPCITTWICGIPELIRNRIDGITVTPSDYLALKEAIKELINDQHLRESIGKQGRLRVLDRYNLKHNVKTLSQIFIHEIL